MSDTADQNSQWRERVPVSFAIDETERQSGRWKSPDWELAWFQVLEGDKPLAFHVDIDESREGVRRTRWNGFSLRLYKDAGESYWANLMSECPRVFIVCEIDEDSDCKINPQLITASQDEANAHLETDSTVLSVEMPAQLILNLERFVVNNYVPEVKKKRKRVEGDALGSKS